MNKRQRREWEEKCKRYAQRTAKKIATVLSMRRGRVAVDKTVEIIE